MMFLVVSILEISLQSWAFIGHLLNKFSKKYALATPWIVHKTSKFFEACSFIEARALKREGIYPDTYKVLFSSGLFDCFDKLFP